MVLCLQTSELVTQRHFSNYSYLNTTAIGLPSR
jgi:hypothetical protein